MSRRQRRRVEAEQGLEARWRERQQEHAEHVVHEAEAHDPVVADASVTTGHDHRCVECDYGEREKHELTPLQMELE